MPHDYQQDIMQHKLELALARQQGDRRAEAEALCNLGTAYYMTNDGSHALYSYQKAILIARELNDKPLETDQLMNFGRFYWHSRDYDQSLQYATRPR